MTLQRVECSRGQNRLIGRHVQSTIATHCTDSDSARPCDATVARRIAAWHAVLLPVCCCCPKTTKTVRPMFRSFPSAVVAVAGASGGAFPPHPPVSSSSMTMILPRCLRWVRSPYLPRAGRRPGLRQTDDPYCRSPWREVDDSHS